jgi:hypothetical protein
MFRLSGHVISSADFPTCIPFLSQIILYCRSSRAGFLIPSSKTLTMAGAAGETPDREEVDKVLL